MTAINFAEGATANFDAYVSNTGDVKTLELLLEFDNAQFSIHDGLDELIRVQSVGAGATVGSTRARSFAIFSGPGSDQLPAPATLADVIYGLQLFGFFAF
jgi:hypothetical protein